MLDFLSSLSRLLSPLWEMSVTAAYAAAVVVVLRLLLKKRAPKQVLCLLWLVVFARLLIPVSMESPLSIVPDALPGQAYAAEQAPGRPGAGDSVTPVAPQTPVQDQTQNQPGNGAVTPVVGGQNPSLSVPEGVSPVPEAPAVFPWQAVAAGVWLTGAAALGGCALVSWLRLRRRLFDAIRAKDGAWEHPAVDSPFILGVLRPRIYVPAGLAGQSRQFILCHERAHLRRFDHIVKPVCWLALALHWFNPLVWAAFLLMSRDIEAACDEAVVRQLGSKVKADYSYTLLTLATGRRLPAPCPLAFDEGDARGRIRNVLNYRRPALWAIVISVVAAALAAVCLLTDPVAARGPEGGPDPDAAASNDPDPEVSASQAVEGLNYLLDPWMKEILDGERTFSGACDDRAYSIDDLFSFFFGDDQEFNFPVWLGELTIIDLDRDGINELVISSVTYVDSIADRVGHLILRRQGDAVYGYNPNYRGFNQLKADGTFHWSSSAFESGTASMSFDGGQYDLNYITWSTPTDDMQDQRYFVDGRKATWEEFDAAIAAQDAKPEPIWYVYQDGVLLGEEQPEPTAPTVVQPDPTETGYDIGDYTDYYYDTPLGNTKVYEYVYDGPETGGAAAAKAARALAALFMDDLTASSGMRTFRITEYRNLSVTLRPTLKIAESEASISEYRLRKDEIGADRWIAQIDVEYRYEGFIETFGRGVGQWMDVLWQGSPVDFLLCQNGNTFTMQSRYRGEDASPRPSANPYAIYDVPLDAPVVDINSIPKDPDQWYKVAELPDDMIWMFSRNHGQETLLRWGGNFYQLFNHTAHTPLGIMPQLKKLGGGADAYGPLAVISNVDKGTGMYIEELVVYDLDAAPAATDYTHDWKPLRDDFNENVIYQFDRDTRTLTYTYQGQTLNVVIDANDEARLRIEHDYPELKQEDLRLCVTGDFVYYRFDEAIDGGIRVELPVELFVGDEAVPLVFPGRVGWTLRFNGSGFDTVTGSCVLGYPGGT